MILKGLNEPSDCLVLFDILTQDTIYKVHGWEISFLLEGIFFFILNKCFRVQPCILSQFSVVSFIWWEKSIPFSLLVRLNVLKILSFNKRDSGHIIWKASFYFICLNLTVCSFHVGLFHMHGYLRRVVVVVFLGPTLLLYDYKPCFPVPEHSSLAQPWIETTLVLRFRPIQHLIWWWADQRTYGESLLLRWVGSKLNMFI